MIRFLTPTILVAIILISSGCQANLINQNEPVDTGVSAVVYHNHYVEHLNAIIAKAELTISDYKKVQNQEEISYEAISQNLEILQEQLTESDTTLHKIIPKQTIDTTIYTNTFDNDYEKAIQAYIFSYQEWLEENKENLNQAGPISLNSDRLENNYSKFVQSHNHFVSIINEQI